VPAALSRHGLADPPLLARGPVERLGGDAVRLGGDAVRLGGDAVRLGGDPHMVFRIPDYMWDPMSMLAVTLPRTTKWSMPTSSQTEVERRLYE
jgi:hypothetical protein